MPSPSRSATVLPLLCIFTLAAVPMLNAHDHGVTELKENRRPQHRKNLRVPDLPGYKTLKCDFHMHTVFSDGMVWPNIRVQEAWQEGLDAICITDHIEYQPHAKDLPTNHNRAHDIAKDPAAQSNILLIRGSEITRGTPPGHFNALFLEDSSKLVADKGAAADAPALDAAAAQKAFIFWNHPGWKAKQIEGSYEWIPFVDKLHQEGKLHGLEVINGFGFHRKALDWCIDRKLAVMGTSDIHNLTANDYDFANGRTRSMTLVFAKKRTNAAIREALEAGRTAAWSSEYLAGPEELLQGLVQGALSIGPVHHTDAKGVSYREIRNDSDLTFTLLETGEKTGLPDTIELHPGTTRMLSSANMEAAMEKASYHVKNAFIRSETNLTVKLSALPVK